MQTQDFEVITDHQALEYFSTKRRLNGRQVRWSELMAQYHFFLTYRPGTQNAAADALSRKMEDVKTVKKKAEKERTMALFKKADGVTAADTDIFAIDSAEVGTQKRRLLLAQYWWKGLSVDVARYVANCPCRSAKTPRDKTPGLLHPLPVPHRVWQHIVVDFKEMPKDRLTGYNNLLVMVDRLSKGSHLMPCFTTVSARETAMLYYQGPYRHFGLPESVTSDRGPQFVADFTDEMSKILGVNWKLSSSGHSQTAGQAEIMNQYIDQRLRMFVNHAQDDWVSRIPALDFVQNSLPHESTGLSPHEVQMGFPMPQTWDWEKRTELKGLPAKEKLSRQEAQQMAQTLKAYHDKARENILRAQEQMIRQANRHRREPDFAVGDQVLIEKKVWSSSRPSDKLDFPMTRQAFKIKAMKGHSYQLEVPPGWRGTDTFPPDRLRSR